MGAQRRVAKDVVVRVPRVIPTHVSPPNLSGRRQDPQPSKSDAIDSDLSLSSTLDKGKRKAEELLRVQQGRPGARAGGVDEFDEADERPPLRVELGSLPDDQHAAMQLKACASAAEWNSLLRWARAQRGPQWDAGTGM